MPHPPSDILISPFLYSFPRRLACAKDVESFLDELTGLRHQVQIFLFAHVGGKVHIHTLNATNLGARVIDVTEIVLREVATDTISTVKRNQLRDAADQSAAEPASITLKFAGSQIACFREAEGTRTAF